MRHFSPHRIVHRTAAIVAIATQLVACGSVLDSLPGSGSSSESTSLGSTPSRGTLSGVAKDALIRNAKVRIYAWDGAKGDLLGSGTTDERGKYSLQLETRSQPVLLEVSEGIYTEEVTLKNVTLSSDQALFAVQNYTSGQPLTTAITYYTTLATGLAEHLVRLGMNPPDAVVEANTRLTRIIGVDTTSVIPTDILAPDNFSLPELQYGFATAALSSLTERASILNDSEPHTVFTSISFIQSAYDDVRADGVLNGRGVNGEVAFGRIRLTPKIYRNELALHILRIANNTTANRTGRSPMDMFDLAQRLNSATDPIFGGDPVIPIDSERPNVSSLVAQEFPNIENNAVVFGGVNFTAMVAAFPGAASAQLLLDDMVIGSALDPENPSIRLETFNPPISEGLHTLKLRVTDISGAVGESPPLDVNVSNQQTAIANISIDGQFVGMETLVTATVVDPAQPRKIEFSVRPQGATEFVSLATITPDSADTIFPASASINPRDPELAEGDATFKVESTNSAGFVLSREVPFVIDRQSPIANIGVVLTPTAPPPSPLADGSVAIPLAPVTPGRFFDKAGGTPCTPMQPAAPTDSCTLYVRLPFGVTSEVSDNRAIGPISLAVDGTPMGQPFVPTGNSTSASVTFTVNPQNLGQDAERIMTVTAKDKALNTIEVSQPVVFDTRPPTVSNLQITPMAGDNGSTVSFGNPTLVRGRVNISAEVADPFGVASTQISINGIRIPSASAVFTPGSEFTRAAIESLGYDTSNLSDGDNVISVEATDRAGNTFSNRVTVGVENAPPVINLTALRYNRNGCFLDGNVFDSRFDRLVLIPDQEPMQIITTGGTGGAFSFNLFSFGRFVPTTDERFASFLLEATDQFGNTTTRSLNFSEMRDINGLDPRSCRVSENLPGRRSAVTLLETFLQ